MIDTILFCGWNALYVGVDTRSAHRLAVGLRSRGWLGPIIGRGGVGGGFWGVVAPCGLRVDLLPGDKGG